jgi:hypothetical protein
VTGAYGASRDHWRTPGPTGRAILVVLFRGTVVAVIGVGGVVVGMVAAYS